MLRILIKKQLFEVFKGYFYNQKKNKMRSKAGIVVFFIFFLLIMVGVLGGMFTALALSLCGGMVKAGMGWLYFLILSGLAIVFGAFGNARPNLAVSVDLWRQPLLNVSAYSIAGCDSAERVALYFSGEEVNVEPDERYT